MSDELKDERQGLPSASSATRYALCPGSFLLERDIPEPPASSDANSGNKVHAFLACQITRDALTADEQQTADMCAEQEAGLVEPYGRVFNVIREERYWGCPDGKLAWSGKPDVVYNCGNSFVVIDYKTGRNEVTEAVGNLQLRALAVLVWEYHLINNITVAIIQPWVSGTPSVCRYTKEDLDTARREINEIMLRVQQPGQPRNPSTEACRYCKAKAICPEARALAIAPPMTGVPEGVTPEHIAAVLTSETLGAFLDRATQAEAVIEACRSEAKKRIDSGFTVPGWAIKPGANRETITDPQTVFARFVAQGGTEAQFMPAVTLAKGKLKDAVKAATGAKGNALDALCETITAGCTETKQTASSLVKV